MSSQEQKQLLRLPSGRCWAIENWNCPFFFGVDTLLLKLYTTSLYLSHPSITYVCFGCRHCARLPLAVQSVRGGRPPGVAMPEREAAHIQRKCEENQLSFFKIRFCCLTLPLDCLLRTLMVCKTACRIRVCTVVSSVGDHVLWLRGEIRA